MENEKSLTQETIMKAMDWAYEKAVNGNGVPGIDSAEEIANNYLKGNDSLIVKVNRLIRWQNTKAGTSGFVTGIPGLLSMPITLPANITSVLFVQIRMIAAIAKMGGYDIKDDRVKSIVFACLVANTVSDVAKQIGIDVGHKIAVNALKNMSIDILKKINQKVGFKLLFGEKGVINIAKTIPILGGIIGGLFDIISTNTVGNIARDTFISKEESYNR